MQFTIYKSEKVRVRGIPVIGRSKQMNGNKEMNASNITFHWAWYKNIKYRVLDTGLCQKSKVHGC